MPRPLRTPAKPVEQILADLAAARRVRDARVRRLVAAIERARLARARALMDIGNALAEMLRDRLYANLGHRTFAALLAELGIGRTQAFRLIALAAADRAERVAAVGVGAAYAELKRPRRQRAGGAASRRRSVRAP